MSALSMRVRSVVVQGRRRGADLWGVAAVAALPLVLALHWSLAWLGVALATAVWLRLADEPAGRRCPSALGGARAALAVFAVAGAVAIAAAGADGLRAAGLAALVVIGATTPRAALPWVAGMALLLFGPFGGHASGWDALAYGLLAPIGLVGGAAALTLQPRVRAQASPGPAAVGQREDTSPVSCLRSRASERAIGEAAHRTLTLVRSSLRSAEALLFRTDANGLLRLASAEVSGTAPFQGPFDARHGVFGLLAGQDAPLILNDLQQGGHFCPWDPDGRAEGHLIAVPLVDEGVSRGCLVVRRPPDAPPYAEVDGIAAAAGAEQVLAIAHTERLLQAAHRSQAQLERTHAALAALQTALSGEEVCTIARDILRREVPFDFLAFTSVEEEGHRVVFADGEGVACLQHRLLDDTGALVHLATRLRQPVPWGGRIEAHQTAVFGIDDDPLAGTSAVLVMPMMLGNEVLGTLVLADRTRDAFDHVPRPSLELMLHCIAGALANAFALTRIMRQATTDGMTGLLNHTAFKQRADEALARAARSAEPVTLVMLDLDHFKRLNDTWGHAAGDDALRAVGALLSERLREVDHVGRYGGEEFAILLERTAARDAARVAENLRRDIEALEVTANGVRLPITASLGVASSDSLPAPSLQALFAAADDALYAAKRAGRNRVHVCAENARAAA